MRVHTSIIRLYIVCAVILGAALSRAPAQQLWPPPETGPLGLQGVDLRGRKTIIIDPGHGGQDEGARLAGGVAEKRFTLEMARVLRQQLQPAFRVKLTRDDDAQLDALDRAARANREDGDLLVSLHMWGGFAPSTGRRLTIFSVRYGDGPRNSGDDTPDSSSAQGLRPWFRTQQAHLAESGRLAQSLSRQLAADLPRWDIALQPAPLALLAGADMPAVLIEIDPPLAEGGKRLDPDSTWMLPIARSIAQTLQNYWDFGDNGPIIQDLHE